MIRLTIDSCSVLAPINDAVNATVYKSICVSRNKRYVPANDWCIDWAWVHAWFCRQQLRVTHNSPTRRRSSTRGTVAPSRRKETSTTPTGKIYFVMKHVYRFRHIFDRISVLIISTFENPSLVGTSGADAYLKIQWIQYTPRTWEYRKY